MKQKQKRSIFKKKKVSWYPIEWLNTGHTFLQDNKVKGRINCSFSLEAVKCIVKWSYLRALKQIPNLPYYQSHSCCWVKNPLHLQLKGGEVFWFTVLVSSVCGWLAPKEKWHSGGKVLITWRQEAVGGGMSQRWQYTLWNHVSSKNFCLPGPYLWTWDLWVHFRLNSNTYRVNLFLNKNNF